ncbi:Cupredoxin [Cynara cardunculus var. scolymus]|uniref:Cupredoxin n=1 Tax=Cynara cardunculus var. scolymus TaxID=59895 RepID=A0A118K6P2_CYNCS|nr:Cupredoxin [Cynara cardunculus var. scolymus]
MAGRRGSATVAAAVLCLLAVALHCEVAQAAIYVVGGRGGWTFNLSVFNYQKGAHNVVVVNKAGYNGCSTTPRNAKVYTSGKDRIRLVKGLNNFICTLPGHCASGMKIQVSAS